MRRPKEDWKLYFITKHATNFTHEANLACHEGYYSDNVFGGYHSLCLTNFDHPSFVFVLKSVSCMFPMCLNVSNDFILMHESRNKGVLL